MSRRRAVRPRVSGYRQDQALPSLADILDGRPPPAVRREGPPGRESRNSGGGYQILQQLLEDVTGRAFSGLAEEMVMRPAGMTTATYAQPDPADAAAPHIAGPPEAWKIYPEHAAAGQWLVKALAGDTPRGSVTGK